MSEREELEAVAKALAEDDGQMWEGLSLQDHYMRQALAARTALISSGYTKGNGELVEAVRECLAYFELMNVTGSLPDQCRAALSNSEGGAASGGDDLRGPVAWLIADPDLMNESAWTIESDPAPESHGVSMPLHIHPDHAAAFDALIESAGSKRPYHAILAARSAASRASHQWRAG
jgi:hypothetical protein